MHPELIKAHLRIGGTTPAALATELGVSPMTVSQVIHGNGSSRRIAERIAQVLGKSVAEIWPQRYGANGKAGLVRRTAKRAA
jgi:putative transcriptional regulator